MSIIDNVKEPKVSEQKAKKSEKVLQELLESPDCTLRQERGSYELYLPAAGDTLELAVRTVLVGWEKTIEEATRWADPSRFSGRYRQAREKKERLSSLYEGLKTSLPDLASGPVVWDGMRIHPELLAVKLYHARGREPQFRFEVYQEVPRAYALARELAAHVDGAGLTARLDPKAWATSEECQRIKFAADMWGDRLGTLLCGYDALGPFYVEPLVKGE